jgi:hypothetical protein
MSYLFYNLIVAAKEVTKDLPADQAAAINKIFELVDALAEDLTRTQRLVDEQIREVEEVAKDLCGWTEGEEHPEDMRVSLALAHLVANATPRSESASASASLSRSASSRSGAFGASAGSSSNGMNSGLASRF